MTRPTPLARLLTLGLATFVSALLVAPLAFCQTTTQGAKAHQIRSTQSRPAPQANTGAGRYRKHGQYRGAKPTPARPNHAAARYLSSPLGVAIPPQQAWPNGTYVGLGYGDRHSYPSYPPVYAPPSYVFLGNEPSGEPRVYGEPTADRDGYGQPPTVVVQPAPVYIVQQPSGAPAVSSGDPGTRAPTVLAPVAPSAAPTAPADARTPPPQLRPIDRPTSPQAVAFRLMPEDAQVFLDDELLGYADEVMAHSPLTLDPGVYVLEVLHPEHPSQRLVFGVDGQEGVSVVVDLAAAKPHRRTRVK